MGRALEPVGQLCGFDWRINVAVLVMAVWGAWLPGLLRKAGIFRDVSLVL